MVVQGLARVTIDKSIRDLKEGESAYIPKGTTHRLENPWDLDLLIIEIQTGSYLGEDDIIRYEDLYARK